MDKAIANSGRDFMKTVMVMGIFDLFGMPHIEFLKQAKEFGDNLVLVLGNDARTKFLKGKNRPIQPIWQRLTILEQVKLVDAVFVANTPGDVNPGEMALRILKPDIYALDTTKDSGDYPKEKKICKDLRIKVVHIPRWEPIISTTELIKRVNND